MIKTFKCRDTEALFDGVRVARFANFAVVAIRKLQMYTPLHELSLYAWRHRTDWRSSLAIESASGAFASMTNSASASSGAMERPGTSKSSITIEEQR